MTSGNKIEYLIDSVLAWYDRNKRDLPWRINNEPYNVWVSEIMLQQTRIPSVVDRYVSFISEYPDLEALANSDEGHLMKCWEGLGYYSRATNMKKAAHMIVSDFGGRFPTDYEDLVRLPGIGDYTANAICAISYNQKRIAVDGNVLRVVSRYLPVYEDVSKRTTKKLISEMITPYINDCAGSLTQAVMELGEIICLPNGEPKCSECPLFEECFAYKNSEVELLPVKKKTSSKTIKDVTVFIIKREDGKYGIRKRPNKGLLANLWEFPNCENRIESDSVYDYLLNNCHISPTGMQDIREDKHMFTHLVWSISTYYLTCNSGMTGNLVWADRKELSTKYALPTAFIKLMQE